MRTRFTLLFLGIASWALAQKPAGTWQIPDGVERRLVVKSTRLYFGMDLGYSRSQVLGNKGGHLLSTPKAGHELFPGLTLGWRLSRRFNLETGLYNLPSTIAYTVELHQTDFSSAGLGIQYAMVPLRLKARVWQPTHWLSTFFHVGGALALNANIRKGEFERLNSVYPPVLGDVVEVTDHAVMIHTRSLLLEAGGEVHADVGHNLTVVVYGRAVRGLQPLWQNDVTYRINQQEPPSHLTLTAWAGGITFGAGVRYTFKVARRYRTVWE